METPGHRPGVSSFPAGSVRSEDAGAAGTGPHTTATDQALLTDTGPHTTAPDQALCGVAGSHTTAPDRALRDGAVSSAAIRRPLSSAPSFAEWVPRGTVLDEPVLKLPSS